MYDGNAAYSYDEIFSDANWVGISEDWSEIRPFWQKGLKNFLKVFKNSVWGNPSHQFLVKLLVLLLELPVSKLHVFVMHCN